MVTSRMMAAWPHSKPLIGYLKRVLANWWQFMDCGILDYQIWTCVTIFYVARWKIKFIWTVYILWKIEGWYLQRDCQYLKARPLSYVKKYIQQVQGLLRSWRWALWDTHMKYVKLYCSRSTNCKFWQTDWLQMPEIFHDNCCTVTGD
jgi:hypothetical protein